jgi:murein DD-endopeptidase MepM/ murein hydrolase activator NlpD
LPQPAAAVSGHGRRFLLQAGLLFALSFMAGAGLVGQFSNEAPPAPPPVTAPEAPATLPPAAPPAPVPGAAAPAPSALVTPELAQLELRRGDTLLDLLTRAGIAMDQAHAAMGSLRQVADLRRLPIGQRLALQLDTAEGAPPLLARLVLPVSAATEVHLVRATDGSFAASSVERELHSELAAVAAPIADSFYADGIKAGLPPATLAEMIKLLSWDVDFQRDIQPGDRLEAVYRRHRNEAGELADDTELQFAGLATGDRVIEAYRFAPADDHGDFFDRAGRPLRKWLLRTPVDGARLSSSFGVRRHPILGYTRMHKGIDFAAPTGTPVLAAGAGVVEFAGRNQGYGNYVRLRHNREFATAYGHLSRLAPALAPGRRVGQGEVIGYVGATGLATGPHLHYELLRAGEQVNPLTVRAEGADPLRGEQLRRFLLQRDEIDRHRQGAAPLVANGGPIGPPPAPL